MSLEGVIIALHTRGKLGHGGFGKQEVIQEKGLGFKLRETIQYHILLSEML